MTGEIATGERDADSQRREIRFGSDTFPINKTASIVLSPDHKAAFYRVPEDYFDRGFKAACSITGNGSWSIGKNDNFTVVIASITNAEPNSPCKGEFAYELFVYGKEPPYRLHITIGDPDSGDAIQFEKR